MTCWLSSRLLLFSCDNSTFTRTHSQSPRFFKYVLETVAHGIAPFPSSRFHIRSRFDPPLSRVRYYLTNLSTEFKSFYESKNPKKRFTTRQPLPSFPSVIKYQTTLAKNQSPEPNQPRKTETVNPISGITKRTPPPSHPHENQVSVPKQAAHKTTSSSSPPSSASSLSITITSGAASSVRSMTL